MADAGLQLDVWQQAAWEDIRSGQNVLVTGPAGTGKSALMSHVTAQFDRMGVDYALTALTGQAAELVGGATLHSCFGWAVPQTVKDFEISTRRHRWLAKLQCLIIDEVSMLSAEFLQHLAEAMEAALAAVAASGGGDPAGAARGGRRFAGLQLVLVGDFHQLPPVVKPGEFKGAQEAAGVALLRALRGAPDGKLGADQIRRLAPFLNRGLAFQSTVWQDLDIRVHTLKQVHRQHDRRFVDLLHALREGRHTPAQLQELGRLARPLPPAPGGILPTTLYCTNFAADNLNEQELKKLAGPASVYCAIDDVAPKTYANDKPEEVEERRQQLVGMRPRVLARDRKIRERLELRLGAQVCLCANLSRNPYLINGSRGVVVGWEDGHAELLRLKVELQRLQELLPYEARDALANDAVLPIQRTAHRSRYGSGGAVPASAASPGVQHASQQAQQAQRAGGGASSGAAPTSTRGSVGGSGGSGEMPSGRATALSQLRLSADRRQHTQAQQQPGSQLHHSQPQHPSQQASQPRLPTQQQAAREEASPGTQHPAPPPLQQQFSTPAACAGGAGSPRQVQPSCGAGPSRRPLGLSPVPSPLKRRLDSAFQDEAADAAGAPVAGSQETAAQPPLQRRRLVAHAVGGEGQPWTQQQQRQQEGSRRVEQEPEVEQQEQGQEERRRRRDLAMAVTQPVDQWSQVPAGAQQQQRQLAPVKIEGDVAQQGSPPAARSPATGGRAALAAVAAAAAAVAGGHAAAAGRAGAGAALRGEAPQVAAPQVAAPQAAADVVDLTGDDDAIEESEAEEEAAAGAGDPLDSDVDVEGWGAVEAEAAAPAFLSCPYAGEPLLVRLSKVRADVRALELFLEQAQGMPVPLPVVRFRSCDTPVVIKPRAFEHKIRNIGCILRTQVPLMLAWAMTIHKAQGASLDYALVDVGGAFAEGQVYVALSRVRSMEGLQVQNLRTAAIKTCAEARRFYGRGGAPLPPRQALRFPAPNDMPPDFYAAMDSGEGLDLADSPHLAGPAPFSPMPAQRQRQQQQAAGRQASGGRGHTQAEPAPSAGGGVRQGPGAAQRQQQQAAAPLRSQLVPVQLQLLATSSSGGGAGPPNGQGEGVVVDRAFLRDHAGGDVAALLRVLCEECEAPPGRQWDLLCCASPGGVPLRVRPALAQLGTVLEEAHSLVVRERRAPAG